MSTDPSPLLERADLDRLREMVGREFLEILEQFLKASADEASEIGQCLHRYDLSRALMLTHSLRGASEQVGARALAQHAANIETLLEFGDIHAIPPLLEQLTQCMRQTEQAYRSYMVRLAGDGGRH